MEETKLIYQRQKQSRQTNEVTCPGGPGHKMLMCLRWQLTW